MIQLGAVHGGSPTVRGNTGKDPSLVPLKNASAQKRQFTMKRQQY